MPRIQPEPALNPVESIQPAYPKDDEAASSSALSEDDVQPYAVRYQEEGGAGCSPYAVAYGDQDDTDSSNTKTSSSCSNDTENSALDGNLHDIGHPLTAFRTTSLQNALKPNPMYGQGIPNPPNPIAQNPTPNAHQEASCDDEAVSSSALSEDDVQPYAVRYQEEGGAGCTPYAVAYGDQDDTDSSNTKTPSSCSNNTENSALDENLHGCGIPMTVLRPTSVKNARDPNPMYGQDMDVTVNPADPIEAQNVPNPMPNAHQEASCENYTENVTLGGKGKAPGKLDEPQGAAVSAENEVFVTDTYNKRVQVFSMTGIFLRLFPTVVPGEQGRTMYPYDIAIDKEGHPWVVGKYLLGPNHVYVVQYSQDGHPVTTIDVKIRDYYPKIAVDTRNNETIVLASNKIFMFQPDGSFDGSFGKEEGVQMKHVTSDKDGNILITDPFTSNVHVYNHSGHPLFSFRTVSPLGHGEGDSWPRGICTDSIGHIIVADSTNRRVDMFTSRGEFIRTIVNIKNPHGLALGPDGDLVVTNVNDDIVTTLPSKILLQ
ncbi:TRIM3 [Branchiostoma lanceolatum]|uniref:TRIM3 protein n=1 Tax=Branchiostoma lanceolatum TaxID=7740 RepID=A0A8K0E866_BRALA|nr:TRIM3 [Branchiostoma lanceolatum]